MPAFIQSLVGPPAAYTNAKAAAPAATTVTTLNGNGVSGSAEAATVALTGLGFKTGPAGSTTETKQTLVEYPAGQEAGAKAVVAHVSGATAVLSTTVTGVTLVLGTDGGHVVVPSTTPPTPATTSPSSPAVTTAPSAPSSPAPSATSPATTYSKTSCIN